eukprot:407644-Amphidinium_carterae.1
MGVTINEIQAQSRCDIKINQEQNCWEQARNSPRSTSVLPHKKAWLEKCRKILFAWQLLCALQLSVVQIAHAKCSAMTLALNS